MEDGVNQSDDLRMFNQGWIATLVAMVESSAARAKLDMIMILSNIQNMRFMSYFLLM